MTTQSELPIVSSDDNTLSVVSAPPQQDKATAHDTILIPEILDLIASSLMDHPDPITAQRKRLEIARDKEFPSRFRRLAYDRLSRDRVLRKHSYKKPYPAISNSTRAIYFAQLPDDMREMKTLDDAISKWYDTASASSEEDSKAKSDSQLHISIEKDVISGAKPLQIKRFADSITRILHIPQVTSIEYKLDRWFDDMYQSPVTRKFDQAIVHAGPSKDTWCNVGDPKTLIITFRSSQHTQHPHLLPMYRTELPAPAVETICLADYDDRRHQLSPEEYKLVNKKQSLSESDEAARIKYNSGARWSEEILQKYTNACISRTGNSNLKVELVEASSIGLVPRTALSAVQHQSEKDSEQSMGD